jgi:type I phosphodiesterase/nucleotide pyrophosphatase
VLADGLGWELLLRCASAAPYLSSLIERGRSITAGVPSTTATSLTSLGTGLVPGRHGVVGFTSRIPGTDRLLDALRWDSRVDPLDWQPHETAFERAARQGVPVTVVSRRTFEKSGLTRAGQRGGEFRGADSAGERIAAAAAAACVAGSLTYLYDADLDATGHRSGCDSSAWKLQLEAFDHFLLMLRSRLPDGCALVVVADHGMVDVPLARRVDVDDSPELRAGVRLLGGEARLRQLYCDAADVDGVVRRWSDRLGDAALVLRREEAVSAGWFGPVSEAVAPRIGDVLVASVGEVAIVSRERFPHEAKLLGLHGSLTPDEMLVPLLVDAPA